MTKKLFLLQFLTFFIFSNVFSQGKYEDSIKNIIEKDFAHIEAIDFKNLVPYETGKGMGYLNTKNNKTVLKPSYYKLDFAKPNLKGNYNDIAYFEINSETKEVNVFIQNWKIYEVSPRIDVPLKKGYAKGFYVVSNSIHSYSDSYSWCPNLFKYKDEYFAIAQKDEKYAVINPEGETRPNLNFDYSKLEIISLENDRIWFKYKTTGGEEGFINMDGEKKLTNNIISNSRSIRQGDFSFIDTEHSTHINYYGYSIETNDELYGVLDLITMEWLIKPQKKFKIAEINYPIDKNLDEKYNLAERSNIKFYFLVIDEKNQTSYYIDDKFKKYLPKR